MTLDEVIANYEKDAVELGVEAVKAALVAWVPAIGIWFLSGFGNLVWKFVAAPAVRWILNKAMKKADSIAYYAYKAEKNNEAAESYQDTIRGERLATESGDANAIQEARAKKRAAFLILFPLTA